MKNINKSYRKSCDKCANERKICAKCLQSTEEYKETNTEPEGVEKDVLQDM